MNGQRVQSLSVNSGGWQTVGKKSLKVSLQKGRNTIRLSNASGWMPDIDYIDLVTTTPNAIRATSASGRQSAERSFDLSGRPANASTPIRIQNGKKIVGSHVRVH